MTNEPNARAPRKARLEIVNSKGLHARASAKFAETAQKFDATIRVSRDSLTVSGSSLMGLLLLLASKGTFIDVETEGAQAEEAIQAITALVTNGFGERD